MLIAQMSDLHIRPSGCKLYDHIDTNLLCARHVAYINSMSEKPDGVVISGDIVNCGTEDEYEMALQILRQLDFPTYIIPGNHDNNDNFVKVFADHFPGIANDPNKIFYTVEDFPVRMIFLDSSKPGDVHGNLGAETLSILEKTLQEDTHKETVIFMHHHPLLTGCLHMDLLRCMDGEELVCLLKKYPMVSHIICGHTHRTIFQQVEGILICTSPSVAHQIPFNSHDMKGSYSLEQPGMLMHRYTKETGFVSYVMSLAPFDGPFRFDTTCGCP